ncbi:MAG: DUF2062 domain-containing protein [Rubrivivax sp.]|nr:DUF2062 domain-containing protein [Rubrivivax sp.]
MFARIKRLLPDPGQLAGNRWLRWLGPRMFHPRLWHVSRRGVALGVAIGVFFGFLIPIAQIPVSAAVAVALRANLPTAVASTLVTNPVTFPPVYYAAWKVGGAILGEPPPRAGNFPEAESESSGWQSAWHFVSGVGRPLVLGLALFAIASGIGLYLLISLGWVLRVRWRRRRRVIGRLHGH